MLKPITLTARLTALFALVSAAMLLGLGVLVMLVNDRHFAELDRRFLEDKAHLIEAIVAESRDDAELQRRLDEVLDSHQGLFLRLARDGKTIHASPGIVFPDMTPSGREEPSFDWRAGSRHLRGLTHALTAPDGASVRLTLALDSSQHLHFQDQLARTLSLYLVLAVVLSGVLGWWAAHRGLAPLRTMRERVRAVTAQHLEPRMPVQGVPVELADLAASLNTMLERLQQDFRRLQDFSSDLAHELRTPISNLLTQTQVMLTQQRDAAAYRETLASNAEEFQRLARMVADMLFLAKADNDLLVPHRESVDLAAEVRALFEFFEVLAEEKGVALHCAGQAMVAGDRLMLRRALSNLLSNAIRHTPAGGRIEVRIEDAGEAGVRVENTGETIAAEHLPRLFDRFYRADAARRQQEGGDGAGLGLAIVQSIVRAHGGRIGVTSVTGLTRFDILLPKA
jgi:two-component system heavy metal sensor histidine kinase CusS